MVRSILFLFALACALAFAGLGTAAAETNDDDEIGSGRLRVVTKGFKDVDVPLAHTEVEAFVSGFVTRVNVTQKFINPYDDPIEAVYVFPLPAEAAVDDMTMTVGERVIKGVIKKREEAREIYEQAKAAGKTASLLDQERPNIFTQAVANILPGDNIEIRISYVEVLKYEEGGYEFVFPMVVGPRYIPGEQIIGKQGGGWAPDTNRVPDASRITPPVLKPGERSGHDIGVTVHLDAGVPIQDLRSPSHMIVIDDKDDHRATIKLDARDTIPNKDLIVRYDVAGDAPEFGVLTHGEKGRGEFLLVLAPMADYSERDVRPREILFVVDSSGSQQGDPLAKSKDAVKRALKGLRPNDTFQVYDFNDTVTAMAPGPLPATAANVRDAMKFVDQIQATGGTRMLPAIQAALNWPADKERVRIVFMTTDGFIGNEVEIIREIHDHLGDARLFSLGVGSSVNRYLLDRMAEEGRGFVQFVRQDESTKEVVEKFHKRIDAPLMTDIAVDWDGLEVTDVYPDTIPDLFAGQPVVIHGRYTKPGRGTVRLIGNKGRGRTELTADVVFPPRRRLQRPRNNVGARENRTPHGGNGGERLPAGKSRPRHRPRPHASPRHQVHVLRRGRRKSPQRRRQDADGAGPRRNAGRRFLRRRVRRSGNRGSGHGLRPGLGGRRPRILHGRSGQDEGDVPRRVGRSGAVDHRARGGNGR
ncbi:MAG: VIT domain-containing protein [Deltaproteobacteria bacterium]|nr:VIT domain-containing protein [Deltaproteobacteria bacterium]